MRTIIVIADQPDISSRFTSLLARFLPFASITCIGSHQVLPSLRKGPPADLIIYASTLPTKERYRLFLFVRDLSPQAKVLLYVDFIDDQQYLFEYMQTGVNGLLSRNASLFEHNMAIDVIMRGDFFVDHKMRCKLLKMQR